MNDLRRIDLNLLVILDALLSEQHVTRAAARLHLSQPAVSHALARLRDLLGDPLLVRAGAGLVPTSRAMELMAPLTEALAQVQSLLAPNAFDPATTRRTFRLAMSDYGAAIVLPGLIRTLRSEAPGIDLQISHASREGMLDGILNGDIDIAVGVFPEMPNELRSTPLFEEHYACLVDRDSLPADATLDLPAYLARPHVLLEMRGSGTPEIERALTALHERRRVAVEPAALECRPAVDQWHGFDFDRCLPRLARPRRGVADRRACAVSYSVVYLCVGVAPAAGRGSGVELVESTNRRRG